MPWMAQGTIWYQSPPSLLPAMDKVQSADSWRENTLTAGSSKAPKPQTLLLPQNTQLALCMDPSHYDGLSPISLSAAQGGPLPLASFESRN